MKFRFFFFRRSSFGGRYHLLRLLCCLHSLFKSFFFCTHFVFYLFSKQSFHPGFYNTHNIIATELGKKSFCKVEKLSNYIFNHGICFWVCAKVQPPKVGYKKSVHFVHFFFIAQKSFMPTLRVFKANGFSSFMFQKLNINDWLSITSTNETLNTMFHLSFHSFIQHLLHCVLKSLAQCFWFSCIEVLIFLHDVFFSQRYTSKMKHWKQKWNIECICFSP